MTVMLGNVVSVEWNLRIVGGGDVAPPREWLSRRIRFAGVTKID